MMNPLTKHSESKVASSSTTQFLTFKTGGETFAIDILDVKEIIEIEAITRVPMMPAFIIGIINLRGRVVPVVDLSSRLGRTTSTMSKKSCIVLVEVNHSLESNIIGMMVDEVHEIVQIDEHDTQPPPDFGTEIRTDFISSMGRVDERFIILLDVNHVLSIEDISTITKIKHEHENNSGEEWHW